MRKPGIKRSLRSRVTKLESELRRDEEPPMRMGYVIRELERNYVGERHMAVVRVVGNDSYGREWCEVEERPGPAPSTPAERLPVVSLTESDMKLCFGPEFKWRSSDQSAVEPR
jgi:hypothetical protein